MTPDLGVSRLLGRSGSADREGCGCRPTLDGATLVVDADACRADGRLEDAPRCRAAVVDALSAASAERIGVRAAGRERTVGEVATALFDAAGTFAASVRGVDDRLAARTRRDPLGAAREAAGRAGRVAELARDAGLARYGDRSMEYSSIVDPTVGPTASAWRVAPGPPPESTLVEGRTGESRARVRIYDVAGRDTRVYHLEPEEVRFDDATARTLEAAHEYLATTPLGGERAADRAVRAVADEDERIAALTRVLRKHTREPGLLRDFFADPALSDVYLTAPAPRNAVRVRVDGETFDTNVTVTGDGVRALASRFRRESGRGFSRATPVLDAATEIGDRRVRVAGVTEPVSDGHAFAFRAHDRTVWTLPALVENGTVTARAAGLLSVAVERGAATLVAGPRGSGKTTLLGALLWEVPPPVRTVAIEDAPELPVRELQAAGRDVQGLRADEDGVVSPAAALRAALRLGDGALVVGEVRGEEASVLYEAMRVGANGEAVLGTIHGGGAEAVYERVVSDLGVPASAFGATDLLVGLETAHTDRGPKRRVRAIEEVVPADPVAFETLFERRGDGLAPAGRVKRGDSRLVARLARPREEYADALDLVGDRAARIERLASTGRTDHRAVNRAIAAEDP